MIHILNSRLNRILIEFTLHIKKIDCKGYSCHHEVQRALCVCISLDAIELLVKQKTMPGCFCFDGSECFWDENCS